MILGQWLAWVLFSVLVEQGPYQVVVEDLVLQEEVVEPVVPYQEVVEEAVVELKEKQDLDLILGSWHITHAVP